MAKQCYDGGMSYEEPSLDDAMQALGVPRFGVPLQLGGQSSGDVPFAYAYQCLFDNKLRPAYKDSLLITRLVREHAAKWHQRLRAECVFVPGKVQGNGPCD